MFPATGVGDVEHDDATDDDREADDELDEACRLAFALSLSEVHLVGGERQQGEPDEHGDQVDRVATGELVQCAIPFGSEDVVPELVSVGVADVTHLDLIDDQLRETELRSA